MSDSYLLTVIAIGYNGWGGYLCSYHCCWASQVAAAGGLEQQAAASLVLNANCICHIHVLINDDCLSASAPLSSRLIPDAAPQQCLKQQAAQAHPLTRAGRHSYRDAELTLGRMYDLLRSNRRGATYVCNAVASWEAVLSSQVRSASGASSALMRWARACIARLADRVPTSQLPTSPNL